MKLKELNDRLNDLLTSGYSPDDEVVVHTTDKSIGPSACVFISQVSPGFDWDSGKVIVILWTTPEVKRRDK